MKQKGIQKIIQERDKSKVKCFKCEKFGQTRTFCLEQKKIQATLVEIKEEKEEKEENFAFYLALSS